MGILNVQILGYIKHWDNATWQYLVCTTDIF